MDDCCPYDIFMVAFRTHERCVVAYSS